MPETNRSWGGKIRKVWPTEQRKFRDHLLRLDKASREMRFAHGASDRYVEEYAGRMGELGSIVYGFFEDGEIRAAAELKKISDAWGHEAEAAFSVETPYQGLGVGTELMGRVIRSARNRSIRLLFMSCLAENRKMQNIAKHYEADLRFEYGEVVGEIVPQDLNYFSVLTEAMEDRVGFMMAVLDIQSKASKAA
jgi:GNAT superfamily N-acetyltransferase